MAKLNIEQAHALPVDEVKKRLQTLADRLSEKYGISRQVDLRARGRHQAHRRQRQDHLHRQPRSPCSSTSASCSTRSRKKSRTASRTSWSRAWPRQAIQTSSPSSPHAAFLVGAQARRRILGEGVEVQPVTAQQSVVCPSCRMRRARRPSPPGVPRDCQTADLPPFDLDQLALDRAEARCADATRSRICTTSRKWRAAHRSMRSPVNAKTRPVATTVALLVATFLSSMDVTVVGTALPRIAGQLGQPRALSVGVLRLHADLDGDRADVGQARRPRSAASPCFSSGSASSSSARLACGAAPTDGLARGGARAARPGAGAILGADADHLRRHLSHRAPAPAFRACSPWCGASRR